MKWRLQEGEGEAFYEIGVEDCGMLTGLTDEEMDASLYTVHKMAERSVILDANTFELLLGFFLLMPCIIL